MQINTDLLQKIKVASVKNADSYLEKILCASVDHGNFGMDLLDRLRDQLPPTKCGNCGKCCNSISIYSLEYHRIVRDLMTGSDPSRLRRFFIAAMRMDLRQAEVGAEKRLRCLFRDDQTKVCLIHQVRPFACRIFGLLKEDMTRECDQVEDLVYPPRVVSEKMLEELQAKILENSEGYEVFPGTGVIHFFPFEFWVFRYLFSPERALQIYREILIPMSTPLTKFWQEKRKLEPIKDSDFEI
ncbi:MAG: putative zinc- or iron-chelating domain [Clostridiales bacterium]|nr:putative zinc- or iron-chelating domain [Clostridiales bacterium]MDN5283237.1 putative zinc- or iron-chelating domain [Candidatus Ozemobacter sp.]